MTDKNDIVFPIYYKPNDVELAKDGNGVFEESGVKSKDRKKSKNSNNLVLYYVLSKHIHNYRRAVAILYYILF